MLSEKDEVIVVQEERLAEVLEENTQLTEQMTLLETKYKKLCNEFEQ